jgi:hypothetical protein
MQIFEFSQKLFQKVKLFLQTHVLKSFLALPLDDASLDLIVLIENACGIFIRGEISQLMGQIRRVEQVKFHRQGPGP